MLDISGFFLAPKQPVRIGLDPRINEVAFAAQRERHRRVAFALTALGREMADADRPRTLGMIGAGHGVEAIAVAEALPGLERIILAERDPAILVQAAANIRDNVRTTISVDQRHRPIDLLNPLAAIGEAVDILFLDLTDAPHTARPGAVVAQGTTCPPIEGTKFDALLNGYLLALPCQFLRAARHALKPDGFTLLLLGSRFYVRLLDVLAQAGRVDLFDVICGLEQQDDAANVLSAYVAAEADGIGFDFYEFDLGGDRSRDPITRDSLESFLTAPRISAHTALRQFKTHKPVGYTYFLFRAVPW
jgi:hypothetical protein